jgi:hypothetical protein
MIRTLSLVVLDGLLVLTLTVFFVLLQYALPRVLRAQKHEFPDNTSPVGAVPAQEEQAQRPAFLSRVTN